VLKQTMTEKGMLWRCDTCAGLAVNVAVLRKCLDTKIVREFWLRATNESQLSERKCPSCMQTLKEFTVGEYNRQVQLDLCKMCQLIWFDRNELEMFRDVKKERPDTKRRSASPRAGIETPFVYENETVGGIAYLCLQALCETIRLFLFPR
jgi:Zn-finger nucleic acid-binding protein